MTIQEPADVKSNEAQRITGNNFISRHHKFIVFLTFAFFIAGAFFVYYYGLIEIPHRDHPGFMAERSFFLPIGIGLNMWFLFLGLVLPIKAISS